MEPLRMVGWEGLAMLGLGFGLALYKAVGRREWWRGVLKVEEMQLMVVTVVVGARLVTEMVSGPGGTLAGVGAGWLMLFGVSGGVYGAMKGWKLLR